MSGQSASQRQRMRQMVWAVLRGSPFCTTTELCHQALARNRLDPPYGKTTHISPMVGLRAMLMRCEVFRFRVNGQSRWVLRKTLEEMTE